MCIPGFPYRPFVDDYSYSRCRPCACQTDEMLTADVAGEQGRTNLYKHTPITNQCVCISCLYRIRQLIVGSHKASKARDWWLEFSSCSEIWQACQYGYHNNPSCVFDTSWDLTIRRLILILHIRMVLSMKQQWRSSLRKVHHHRHNDKPVEIVIYWFLYKFYQTISKMESAVVSIN